MRPFEFHLDNWLGKALSLAILFLSIAGFAFTGSSMMLAIPFAYLFVLLIIANWRMAYWILLFTIPASINIYLLGESLSTSLPDEPIMWMFLLVFILLMVARPRSFPRWALGNTLIIILVFQFIWMLVAVAFSKELLISVKFALAKCWFLVSFIAIPLFVFRGKKDLRRAFILVLIPIFVTMSIIMIRHAATGFNFREIDGSITFMYYNHVEYSTVLSMFFPLLLVAFYLSKGRTGYRIFWGALILYFLAAIYLSYARAAMLAVVFALIVATTMRFRLLNWVMPLFYAGMIFLVGYMIHNNEYIKHRPNYQQTYMHDSFTDHIIATFKGRDMSSMERLYRWIAGARMSMDEPWTGVGPNAFYYYYKPYAVSSFRTYVSRNPERSTTHNYFLFMLVEQGWPAMILYGVLVVAVFAKAQRIYFRFKDKFYKACTMGMAMMFAAGFVNNFFSELLEMHKVGFLFFISIAILVILDKKSKDEQKQIAETGTATVE